MKKRLIYAAAGLRHRLPRIEQVVVVLRCLEIALAAGAEVAATGPIQGVATEFAIPAETFDDLIAFCAHPFDAARLKEGFMANNSSLCFVRGERYTVVKDGGYVRGFRPTGPSVETLWRKDLRFGDVLTCAGCAFTAGDGVPIVHWLDAEGESLANDCEFQPYDGRKWGGLPAVGWLARVEVA
jgi:hypothetical protein